MSSNASAVPRSISRPARRSSRTARTAGNQPAHISLTARRQDTLTTDRTAWPQTPRTVSGPHGPDTATPCPLTKRPYISALDGFGPAGGAELGVVADGADEVAVAADGGDDALGDLEQDIEAVLDQLADDPGRGVDRPRDVDDAARVDGGLDQLADDPGDGLEQLGGVVHVAFDDLVEPGADELGLVHDLA